MPEAQPASIGRIVHYVSYGTPNGEYEPEHRAAIVTEVSEDPGVVGLCVLNPTGMFFNRYVAYDESCAGGSWHWPERVLTGRDGQARLPSGTLCA